EIEQRLGAPREDRAARDERRGDGRDVEVRTVDGGVEPHRGSLCLADHCERGRIHRALGKRRNRLGLAAGLDEKIVAPGLHTATPERLYREVVADAADARD